MMISSVEGRADDLRKIRGGLFTPVSVEEVLRKEFPLITEYEILVEKKGLMDEISIRVEPERDMNANDMKAMIMKISERLKMKTNLRFNIQPVKPGELPRYMLKSTRFKDLRGS